MKYPDYLQCPFCQSKLTTVPTSSILNPEQLITKCSSCLISGHYAFFFRYKKDCKELVFSMVGYNTWLLEMNYPDNECFLMACSFRKQTKTIVKLPIPNIDFGNFDDIKKSLKLLATFY